VTPKGQGRDSIICKAPYFDKGARQMRRQSPALSSPSLFFVVGCSCSCRRSSSSRSNSSSSSSSNV